MDEPAKRGRRKSVEKASRRAFEENVPDLLPKFYAALGKKLQEGDPKILKLFAEVMGLVNGTSGVTVNVNQQNNTLNGGPARVRTFDGIIRRLEARDHEHALKSGHEQGLITDGSIQEGEYVDLPAKENVEQPC